MALPQRKIPTLRDKIERREAREEAVLPDEEEETDSEEEKVEIKSKKKNKKDNE